MSVVPQLLDSLGDGRLAGDTIFGQFSPVVVKLVLELDGKAHIDERNPIRFRLALFEFADRPHLDAPFTCRQSDFDPWLDILDCGSVLG